MCLKTHRAITDISLWLRTGNFSAPSNIFVELTKQKLNREFHQTCLLSLEECGNKLSFKKAHVDILGTNVWLCVESQALWQDSSLLLPCPATMQLCCCWHSFEPTLAKCDAAPYQQAVSPLSWPRWQEINTKHHVRKIWADCEFGVTLNAIKCIWYKSLYSLKHMVMISCVLCRPWGGIAQWRLWATMLEQASCHTLLMM